MNRWWLIIMAWIFPFILFIVYYIWTVKDQGEINMQEVWWIPIAVALIALLGVIINGYFTYKASKFNSKDKEGKTLFEKLEEKTNKIGNPKESLSAEHDEIFGILKQDVKNPLTRVNEELIRFTSEQKTRNEFLQKDKNSLDNLTNSIINDREKIKEQQEQIDKLLNIIKNKEEINKQLKLDSTKLQTRNKELLIKINKLDPDNDRRR